jgi:hypothetical protein
MGIKEINYPPPPPRVATPEKANEKWANYHPKKPPPRERHPVTKDWQHVQSPTSVTDSAEYSGTCYQTFLIIPPEGLKGAHGSSGQPDRASSAISSVAYLALPYVCHFLIAESNAQVTHGSPINATGYSARPGFKSRPQT